MTTPTDPAAPRGVFRGPHGGAYVVDRNDPNQQQRMADAFDNFLEHAEVSWGDLCRTVSTDDWSVGVAHTGGGCLALGLEITGHRSFHAEHLDLTDRYELFIGPISPEPASDVGGPHELSAGITDHESGDSILHIDAPERFDSYAALVAWVGGAAQALVTAMLSYSPGPTPLG